MIHSGCMPLFLSPSFSFPPLYIWVVAIYSVFLRMRFFFFGFFLLFIYYYTSVGNNLFTILFIYLSMSPVISVEITSIESAHYFKFLFSAWCHFHDHFYSIVSLLCYMNLSEFMI